MRLMRALAPLTAAALAAATLLAPPARACGGFFCNAQTLSPIYQAGERILFAKHDGRTTMHIEIVYQGDPTAFGWLLPLVEPPTDTDGKPLPLDKAVSISSQRVFDLLQTRTDPIFGVQNRFDDDACLPMPDFGGGQDASSSADADDYDPGPPPVVVLQQAKVGPYDAQLIQAKSSDTLMEWLDANGYVQDPAAKPHLSYYVGMGYVFLGIRLQTGKTTGDLKPIALTLGEDAPCVPLKLTSIAATPNMPMLVWVLGDGRAVPKNFIHAVVNPQAIRFPGGNNYLQVVGAALDTAAGRAWVTEFADSAAPFRNQLLPPNQRDTTALQAASTLSGVLAAVPGTIAASDDFRDLLRELVPMPADLEGYPYGNCYYDPTPPDWRQCPDDDADHVTTEAEFYGYLDYWAARVDEGALTLDVDLAALKQRIVSDLIAPLVAIEGLFASTTTLTRFFTALDPAEMTRDPVFAFNPALPPVSRVHTVQTVIKANADCDSWVEATYPDGSTATFPCGNGCFGQPTIGPVDGAPPIKVLQVLDETGDPIDFAPSQAEEVDALLDLALPGQPSLPATFEPIPPPTALPDAGATPDAAGSPDAGPKPPAKAPSPSSGCASSGPATTLWLALAALAALLAPRRRARVRGALGCHSGRAQTSA